MNGTSCHQRQSLLGRPIARAKLGTHMYIKRVRSLALNGLAFPVETASVAGSCMPFTPFIVHLLLYWP